MTPNPRAIVRTLNTVLKAHSTIAPSKTKLILSKVLVNALTSEVDLDEGTFTGLPTNRDLVLFCVAELEMS
jgi:hypothetical protein